MADKIKLYGTSWCPHTRRSRAIMDRHGVIYTWYDIEEDKNACAFVEQVNNGDRSVPTIVFPDGTVLVEPDDTELIDKCKGLKG